MELLKKFGYTDLKPKQKEIIDSLDQHDTIGIVPTGFGKSFTWQYYFSITKKTVLVIQPLIALMEDQKRKMEEMDIPVVVFNSKNMNKSTEKHQILNGEPHIIYTSPEYIVLCEDFLRALSRKNLLGLIVMDECHCISTYKDYRPEYQKLECLKSWCPKVNTLALTATATPEMIQEISQSLALVDPNVVKGGFQRSNLKIKIQKKVSTNSVAASDIMKCLELIDMYPGKCIIYCKTRKETDEISEKINRTGLSSRSYHAGKEMLIRDEIQKGFTKGEFPIIVSTIAFGMGVDIPDIRLIIHFSLPKSIESMYQEIGRAGRDGKESVCYLFWNHYDVRILKFLIRDQEYAMKRSSEESIHMMLNYVESRACRMQFICHHFGERINPCGLCDVCGGFQNNESSRVNTSVSSNQEIDEEYLSIILNTLLTTNGMGSGVLCDVMYGSRSKKAVHYKHLPHFGGMKGMKKNDIKEIIQRIMNTEFIDMKPINNFCSIMIVSDDGKKFLNK